MGLPVSPVIANIYMEYFESLTIPSSPTSIKWWFGYVDDVHNATRKDQVHKHQEHLNSIDPHLKFTIELPGTDGLPFLDTLTKPTPTSIESTVYRKPTHTDRYLDYNSNHPISAKTICYLHPHPQSSTSMFYTCISCKRNGSPSQSPTRQPLPNTVLSRQIPTKNQQRAKYIHRKVYRRS